MSVSVGEKVVVRMAGLTHDGRVGTLVKILPGKLGLVKFGDRTEVIFPLSKLR